MSSDEFDATFSIRLDRNAAWARLIRSARTEEGDKLWLAGFDSSVTVADARPGERLRVVKDDEPCAGTEILVTLEDDETGTRIHVVQSRFGDWFAARRELMAVGWRYIVADLHAYLATGARAGRFLGSWGDLGADATAADGGLRVVNVRSEGLAARLGLVDGDLLVTLAGVPMISLDDLFGVLRARLPAPLRAAVWIRAGQLVVADVGSDG